MNVPSLETSSFFAENSASGQTTLGSGMGETRPSGSGEGRRFGVPVRVLALCRPTVTHPDALHHRDVLVLVCLEGDPAGAGGPAHGFFCPGRVLVWTREHLRPHAHGRAWTCPDVSFAEREQGHDPRWQGEPPVLSSHLLRSRSTTKCLWLVGGTNGPPPLSRSTWIGSPGPGCYGNRRYLTRFPEPLGIVGIVVSIWRQECWNLLALI